LIFINFVVVSSYVNAYNAFFVVVQMVSKTRKRAVKALKFCAPWTPGFFKNCTYVFQKPKILYFSYVRKKYVLYFPLFSISGYERKTKDSQYLASSHSLMNGTNYEILTGKSSSSLDPVTPLSTLLSDIVRLCSSRAAVYPYKTTGKIMDLTILIFLCF
jgi:hypothetical protein